MESNSGESKCEEKLFLNRTTVVATAMSDVLLVEGGTHSTHLIRLTTHTEHARC